MHCESLKLDQELLVLLSSFIHFTKCVIDIEGAEDVPGDGMKLNPERESFAVQPNASRPAHSIHIRVTFNAVTRYKNV